MQRNIAVGFLNGDKRTEEEGFEPSRRCYRPTGVRSQTLQPLGYSSSLQILYRSAPSSISNFGAAVKEIWKIY